MRKQKKNQDNNNILEKSYEVKRIIIQIQITRKASSARDTVIGSPDKEISNISFTKLNFSSILANLPFFSLLVI